MLIELDRFGGVVPKILDPILLAPEKAQVSENCRFDSGDLEPLHEDWYVINSTLP